jgi:sugar (pentulose or hexulose) kinase
MTSVNMIFFMGGPQLGELEAGAVAALIGAPLSVVTGGVGCLIASAAAALWATSLKRYEGVVSPRVAPSEAEPADQLGAEMVEGD